MERYFEPELLLQELQKRKVYYKIPMVFVDCGCGIPEHCSNSLPFIKLGWEAYLIDGLQSNVDYSAAYYKDNPKVKCLQAILSDREEPVYFEQDKRHWSLSGVKEGIPNATTSRLSKIIEALAIEEIGILSLDVENMEEKILLDVLPVIHPKVLIVEGNDLDIMKRHREILEPTYTFISGIFPNQMFCLTSLL